MTIRYPKLADEYGIRHGKRRTTNHDARTSRE